MIISTVGEVWRYPVKSMGDERLDRCAVGTADGAARPPRQRHPVGRDVHWPRRTGDARMPVDLLRRKVSLWPL